MPLRICLILHRAGYGDSRASRYSTCGGIAVSGIFKPPSGSFSIYFSFYSHCLLPLPLLLSLNHVSLRSYFSPPPSETLTRVGSCSIWLIPHIPSIVSIPCRLQMSYLAGRLKLNSGFPPSNLTCLCWGKFLV